MPKTKFSIPLVFQTLSLVVIAIWWLMFVAWQPNTIKLLESLAYHFEPPVIQATLITAATTRALEYSTVGPKVIAADIFFTQDEVSHLADVSVIFRYMQIALGVGALAGWTILIGTLLQYQKLPSLIFTQASVLLLILAALFLLALIIFPIFFIAFHQVLFPQGNWAFPETSVLIQLFPETFWKLAMGFIMLGMLLFALLFRLLGSHAKTQD